MVEAATPAATVRRLPAPWQVLRAALRGGLHKVMVMSVLARAGVRGAAPCAVFLPSRGREMSSLLRIYVVAASLRRQGWQTAVIPWRLGLDDRHRIISALRPDVLVMQGSRHPLNRPALYSGARIVYDMDDADFHLDHLSDAVRDAMQGVDLVLAGSRYVADWCRANGARAEVIWTGTPILPDKLRPHAARGSVVAWTQTAPATYHAERAFVLDVMRRVHARRPDAVLRLYDRRRDEPDTILAPFRAAGISVQWQPRRTYRQFLRSLQDVAVGLSPICPENAFSRGKSFGKILAYLDRGVAVVAADAVDHPLVLDPGTAVLSNDPETCAAAVCRLLGSADLRQGMADAGRSRLREVFAPQAVAARVDAALRQVLRDPPRQRTAVATAALTSADAAEVPCRVAASARELSDTGADRDVPVTPVRIAAQAAA